MNRIHVVQACLDNTPAQTYLEIGLSRGRAFARADAARKIGVDPTLRITRRHRRALERSPAEVHLFEVPSDRFFAEQEGLLTKTGVDVAFIDGLHTYKQSLRDVNNTLAHLTPDGIVVLHDCNPKLNWLARPAPSFTEFRRRARWWQIAWCGDVWKTIVHLRSTRPDLRVGVLDCDFGIGIVTRRAAEDVLEFDTQQIAAMTYRDLSANRKRLLNLRRSRELQALVAGPDP